MSRGPADTALVPELNADSPVAGRLGGTVSGGFDTASAVSRNRPLDLQRYLLVGRSRTGKVMSILAAAQGRSSGWRTHPNSSSC